MKNFQKKTRPLFRIRIALVAVVFMGLLVLLLWRLGYLITQQAFLTDQGEARALRTLSSPAYRGMILDRNGRPLAVSAPVESIWVEPSVILADKTAIDSLAKHLDI